MTAWEKGFYKEAGLNSVLEKLMKRPQQLANAIKSSDRALLKTSPKGGYAAIDTESVNKNFNLSGFQKGSKPPKRPTA